MLEEEKCECRERVAGKERRGNGRESSTGGRLDDMLKKGREKGMKGRVKHGKEWKKD